jgi:hypothetical protein
MTDPNALTLDQALMLLKQGGCTDDSSRRFGEAVKFAIAKLETPDG